MTLDKLKTKIIGKRMLFVEEIDSTNSEARRLALHGEKEGTVIIATSQVKGRGRHGRRWVSPPGGLYLSVILKPYVSALKRPLIALLLAVAAVRTIRGLLKLDANLKWPNDIMISGKKAGGVLSEATKNVVVSGIGINLNTNLSLFPASLKKQVTSLSFESGMSVDKGTFIRIILEEMEALYRDFLARKYPAIMEEWTTYCETLGRKVSVETNKGTFTGIARSLGERGELNVRLANGKIKKIDSGDVIKVN